MKVKIFREQNKLSIWVSEHLNPYQAFSIGLFLGKNYGELINWIYFGKDTEPKKDVLAQSEVTSESLLSFLWREIDFLLQKALGKI